MTGKTESNEKPFIYKYFRRNSAITTTSGTTWNMKTTNSNFSIPAGYVPIGISWFNSGNYKVHTAYCNPMTMYIYPDSTNNVMAGRNTVGEITHTPSMAVLFVNEDYVTVDESCY